MRKTGVILLGFLPNPRFEKRIALEKEMCDLHVICWDRCQNMMKQPIADGFTLHIIPIKAENDPLKRLLPYHMFTKKAKMIIKELHPDFIHVQGLDMLRIACAIKKKSSKRVTIIYEVADLHRLLVDVQKSLLKKIVQFYMRKVEQHCCKRMDLLIVTSKKYYTTYFNKFITKNKVMYFPNVPDLACFHDYKKKNNAEFTVGFIGGVRYKKQMKILIQAAEANEMKLLIAGFEVQPPEIEALCKNYKKSEWIGRFSFENQIAELYEKCDVIYSVYDADMANVRVAIPNKLYEAIYCELPIIVAKNTYLAQIVEEWGIGVAVDYREATDLTRALKKLKSDYTYYKGLSENCKKYKQKIDLENYNADLFNRITSIV